MEEYQVIELIRQVIRQELTQIFMGKIVATKDQFRTSARRFSSENAIDNQRMIHPYGFASRPKPGTECLVVPVAGDPTHVNVVGQFDSGRPVINDGESVLYGADGQVIYMKNGGTIHQGTKTADEPVVLGNVLKDYITDHLNAFINCTQVGFDSFGLPVYLDPVILQALVDALQKYVTNSSTNVVGQKNFVERGA